MTPPPKPQGSVQDEYRASAARVAGLPDITLRSTLMAQVLPQLNRATVAQVLDSDESTRRRFIPLDPTQVVFRYVENRHLHQ